jgi:hypothetical protein
MSPSVAAFALWNWCVADRIEAGHIRAAVAAASGRPVAALGGDAIDAGPPGALLCDVWHGVGDFPTFVDCYLVPAAISETRVAAGLARRLGVACLLPDDTLNPTRHLLALPDGTLRPAHVKITDTVAGERRSGLRFCTTVDPWCRRQSGCRQSRWAPGSVASAAA